MNEFIGCFGEVSDIRAVKSVGACRIVVDVPIEYHKSVTNAFWGRDVLITPSSAKHGYGMASTSEPGANEPKRETAGGHYQALYKSGFFNNPVLWRWAGSDADYQAWARLQPSCVSGNFSEWVDGIGRCEYAHVRRVANGAGTGIKPEYSGVPLTHHEHSLQHQQGEKALLEAYGIQFDDAQAWFDKQAVKYRTNWIKSVIYEYFEVGSLKEIEPSEFAEWSKEIGAFNALPSVFKK